MKTPFHRDNKLMKKLIWLIVIVTTCQAMADRASKRRLTLSRLFSDHMVLQRDVPVRLWGTASPGETVVVEMADVQKNIKAEKDGRWEMDLPAMSSGGPYVIDIAAGKERLRLEDVLVGDVWLCAGQSNMQIGVAQYEACERKSKVERSSSLRLYQLGRVGWRRSEESSTFSAVGYLFGLELVQTYGVPIGLINVARGGSRIESWIDRDVLTRREELKYIVEKSRRGEALNKNYQQHLNQWKASEKKGERPRLPFPTHHQAGKIFDDTIRRLVNVPVKGVLWYQGENNVELDHQYGKLIRLMIEDWREKWRNPDLWFLIVQLPAMTSGNLESRQERWADLRNAQTRALELSNTAIAIMCDTGGNLHPWNKTLTAHRLALLARNKILNEMVDCEGPKHLSHMIKDGKILILFGDVGAGLASREKKLSGFEIAGSNGKFVSAEAEILEKKSVCVWSPKVTDPVAVRYAWRDDTLNANLINETGFPAGPFRTDTWETLTNNP